MTQKCCIDLLLLLLVQKLQYEYISKVHIGTYKISIKFGFRKRMPEVEKDEMEGEIEGKEAGSKDKDRKHDSGAADLEKGSLLLLQNSQGD